MRPSQPQPICLMFPVFSCGRHISEGSCHGPSPPVHLDASHRSLIAIISVVCGLVGHLCETQLTCCRVNVASSGSQFNSFPPVRDAIGISHPRLAPSDALYTARGLR